MDGAYVADPVDCVVEVDGEAIVGPIGGPSGEARRQGVIPIKGRVARVPVHDLVRPLCNTWSRLTAMEIRQRIGMENQFTR